MSRVTAAKSCHCKLEKGKLQNFRLMCGLEVNANSGKVPKPNRLFTSGRESRRRLWQRLGTAWTWRWRKLKMIAPWTLRRVLMWSGKYQWSLFAFCPPHEKVIWISLGCWSRHQKSPEEMQWIWSGIWKRGSNLRFETITRNLLGSMKANSSVSLRLAEFGMAKKVRK